MNNQYVIFAKDARQAKQFIKNELTAVTPHMVSILTPNDAYRAEGWFLAQGVRYIFLPDWYVGATKEYLTAVKRCGGMP